MKQMAKPLSIQQNAYIAMGALNAGNLKEWVRTAFQVHNNELVVKRHWFITSSPGLAKTFTVKRTCEEMGLKYPQLVIVENDVSLAAFTRKMAIACYKTKIKAKSFGNLFKKNPPLPPIFVVVDDCDVLFANKEGLGVLKGILGTETEVLSYEKDMTSQIRKYRDSSSEPTREIADAVEHYQTEGGLGLSIPMNNVNFIFLTNSTLPTWADAEKKPSLRDGYAVRDRLEYKPIPSAGLQMWGYNAHTILTSNILGDKHLLSDAQKHMLLDWLYTNWDNLQSNSLRNTIDLAAEMINHPENYVDYWNQRLIA